MLKKKIYPQEPDEWNDANNTLYRHFELRSTPDIECLIRLVKENISDKGNSSYLRARLLGILYSQFSKVNKRFWTKHYHPKTWRIRLILGRLRELYRLTFKTKTYRGEVYLCNLSKEVIAEQLEEK